MVKFHLTTEDGEEITVTARVIPSIIPPLRSQEYKEAVAMCREKHPDLELPIFPDPEIKISMLLAGETAGRLTGQRIYKIGNLEIRDTRLNGCYLQGSLPETDDEGSNEIVMLTATGRTQSDVEGILLLEDKKLQKMIDDALNLREFRKEEDEEPNKENIIMQFEKTIKKEYTEDGEFKGYEVSLPWKAPNSREKIPENKRQTMAMTNSNANRMEKLGKLGMFHNSILQHIKEGVLREVDMTNKEDAAQRKFVPSFGVLNPKSTTSPVRLVVAANLPRNNSVNDQLESSLNLLLPLDQLIHRWRIHETAVTADIKSAYYQILLNKEDRKLFNIIWYRNPQERTNPMILELKKLPMGSGPSQAIMIMVFNYHLKSDTDQETARHLMSCLYSDNAVTSICGDSDPHEIVMRMHECMARGGFKLTKFSTNKNELREKLRAENLYNEKEAKVAQVLGLKWIINGKDLCGFNTPEIEEGSKWTKRSVLSFCHTAYDAQTGLLCGILIRGTAFFSSICQRYEWDEELTNEDRTIWIPIHEDILQATEITIPRWYGINTNKPCRLHLFSDASSTHFLACLAYLEQDGKSILIAGKAKIGGKNLRENEDTVPKKELEALVMAARLLDKLIEYLDPHYQLGSYLIHSDATIPLTWILQQSQISRFVANRVKRFTELNRGRASLHHVATHENPADYPSRGMKIDDFLNPNHIYWRGPSLIHELSCNLKPFEITVSSSREGELVLVTTGKDPNPSALNLLDCKAYKTLSHLSHTLANIIRFVRRSRKQKELGKRELGKMAIVQLLKAEQQDSIPEIINYLRTGQGPRHEWIHSMSLFIDRQGLVRLNGTRLQKSGLNYAAKYPILYPKTSPLFNLRILEYHSRGHCGVKNVKATLQRQFWTPAIGKSIQTIIGTCYNCKKATGKAFRPPGPPPLPASRVIPESYAAVGVDYTGFFTVKCGRNNEETKKVYLLIISCASTRHFMGYVVEDLTTETFLHQLRRHAAVFGCPHTIYSDRASNFLSAAEILGRTLAEEWVSDIGEKLGRKGISWVPNPSALSPEMSGHIETIVKLLKTGLKRSIGRHLMGIEAFRTCVSECVCVCNDRPLSVDLSPDPKDRIPVSPNKLLLAHNVSPLPYGEGNIEELDDPSYLPEDKDLGRMWKCLANKLENFRKQFADDWLMTLRSRHIQDHIADPRQTPDINVGDLCIATVPNVKRSLWDLATVERLIPSTDGKTRAIELKTKNGLISRPISKIFPLVKANELKTGNNTQPSTVSAIEQHKSVTERRTNVRPTRAAKERAAYNISRWTKALSADE